MGLIAQSDLKIIDPASVMLRGYAGVFGNVFKKIGFFQTYRYLVERGAFASVLERLGGKPLEVFWDHGLWRMQIGQTTELREDDHGLYFEAEPNVTQEALDVLAVMAGRGSRIGASFSFDFGETTEDDDGVIHIHSFSELYELGPTTWGANPLAYAEMVERDTEQAAIPATEPVEIQPAGDEAALAAALWRATAELRRR